ncbi:hypothetical protein ACQ86N_10960 [Puia sp. P3]|uniref:hypothetical protein n=1 Tax=Puia sp. P3 TaxID=3423952 RepID=UPI003D67570E
MRDRVRAYCDVLKQHGVSSEGHQVKIIPYNSSKEGALQKSSRSLRARVNL